MFYIDDFLNYLKTSKFNSENTLNNNKYILKGFISFCLFLNITSVKQLTNQIILSYLDYIRKSKISEGYFNKKVYITRSYLHYLYRSGLIFFDFLRDYDFQKDIRSFFPVLSQNEIEYILENVKPKDAVCKMVKAILELMYSSALRPREVYNLKINDIDFRGEQLFIQQSKQKKDRIVPIGKYALNILHDYIHKTRKQFLKPDSPENVFLSFKDGIALNCAGLRYVIGKALKKNDLPLIKPYSIRITAATVLYLNGMSIVHLSKFLGHKDIDTTKIYIRLTEKNLKSILEKHHPRFNLKSKEEIQ